MANDRKLQEVKIELGLARTLFGEEILKWMYPNSDKLPRNGNELNEFFISEFFKVPRLLEKERLYPYVLFPQDVYVTDVYQGGPDLIRLDNNISSKMDNLTRFTVEPSENPHDRDNASLHLHGILHMFGGSVVTDKLRDMSSQLEWTKNISTGIYKNELIYSTEMTLYSVLDKNVRLKRIFDEVGGTSTRFKQFASVEGCFFFLSREDFINTFIPKTQDDGLGIPLSAVINTTSDHAVNIMVERFKGKPCNLLRGGILFEGVFSGYSNADSTRITLGGDNVVRFKVLDLGPQVEYTTKLNPTLKRVLGDYLTVFNKSFR
jgi:hypothetical protein